MTSVAAQSICMDNRQYQFWANVSDLHITWLKDAVGVIINKNDQKKLNQLLFDASPWKQLHDHFHGNNPKSRKM